jgi:tetratricopeptide (TPR) repeat protein
MNSYLLRAQMLLSQSRPEAAEEQIRAALAEDPGDGLAHAFLALCLADRKQGAEARKSAETAVGLTPEEAYCHYVQAYVLAELNKDGEAEAAVREALRLAPEDADYHAFLSGLFLKASDWAGALQAAENGLQFDAQHVRCNNFRAQALIQLGRREEAGLVLDAALAREPENAMTHANKGWALLRDGEPTPALERFREALRLEPNMEWARQGVVEALKARNIVYRLMLRWFFWMARLSPGKRWGLVIGGVVGARILRFFMRYNPSLAPVLWPLLGAYILFVFLTWTAPALFELLLRLDRHGRLVLSRKQIVRGNVVGLLLLSAVLCAGIGWWVNVSPLLTAGMLSAFLIIQAASVFNAKPGWLGAILKLYVALLILLALAVVGLSFAEHSAYGKVFTTFMIGWVAYAWLSGFFMDGE